MMLKAVAVLSFSLSFLYIAFINIEENSMRTAIYNFPSSLSEIDLLVIRFILRDCLINDFYNGV